MTNIDGQHEPSVLSVYRGGFVRFVLANWFNWKKKHMGDSRGSKSSSSL